MKFEKRLKTETVPEWRIKYIDYKGLKGKLQLVQRAKFAREKEWTHGPIHQRSENITNDTTPHMDRSEFASMSSPKHYNDKSQKHYSDRSLENKEKRFSAQSLQRTFSMISIPERKASKNNNENDDKGTSQNNDKRFSVQSRTFSMGSMADSVQEFFHRVSSALVTLQKQQNHIPPPDQIRSLDTLMDQVYPEERLFFVALDNELKKIEKFYEEKEKQALERIDVLEQQYKILKEKKDERPNIVSTAAVFILITAVLFFEEFTAIFFRESSWNTSKIFVKQGIDYFTSKNEHKSTIAPESDTSEKQSIDYKIAKKLIRKAVFEFYRSLELLKKYKVLNYTGVVKILKKYDKISERNGTKIYMPKVENSHFVKSGIVKKLLKDSEDFYVDHFEGGSRSQALRKLRLPNRHNKTYYSSTLRVGLYLGLTLPVFIYSLTRMQKEDFQIYAALVLPIIALLLLGVNMYVWSQSNINYKFIFEFNPRENLDFRQYLELPAMILMVTNYIMLLMFLSNANIVNTVVSPYIYPIFSVIFIVGVVFNPFPVLYYNARRWFIYSMARLFGSGILRVEFRDFFISDGLTSLSYSFSLLQGFKCLANNENCHMDTSLFTPLFASIPAWFRLLQSHKRYRDTQQINHLINIGKYGTVIAAMWMAYGYKMTKNSSGGRIFFALWISMQATASIYTFIWDVKMDWSLFNLHSVNYLLRNELGYKYHWLYYFAIITNLILRWSWLVAIKWPNKVVYIAFGEILRRWMWNFFRVENEHTNNCNNCRAVKEHPLPFQTQTDEIRDFETIIPDDIIDVDDSDYDRTPSFSSWSRKLFTTHSIYKRRSNPANNWRDYEPRKDETEYMYPDNIYEESEDSFGEEEDENDDYYNAYESRKVSMIKGHGLSNTYASRSFPPM